MQLNRAYIAVVSDTLKIKLFVSGEQYFESTDPYVGVSRYLCYDDEYTRYIYHINGRLDQMYAADVADTYEVAYLADNIEYLKEINGELCIYNEGAKSYESWIRYYCDNIGDSEIVRTGGTVVQIKQLKTTGNYRVVIRGSKLWTLLIDQTGRLLRKGVQI